MNTTTDRSISECRLLIGINFHYYILPVAFLIATALSLMEGRATKLDQKRVCCGRRLGIPVPVNLLDGNENRLAYAAAFGCFTTKLLYIFLYGRKTYISESGIEIPGYFLYVFTLVLALEMAFLCYPLFICLSWRFTFVHSGVGFVYSLLWLILTLIENFQCSNVQPWFHNLVIAFIIVPNAVCNSYLVWRFSYMLVIDVKDTLAVYRNEGTTKDCESIWTRKGQKNVQLSRTTHLQHVFSLLHRNDLQSSSRDSFWQKMKYFRIITSAYQRKSTFRYSPRITATFFVSALCLYQTIGVFMYLSIRITINVDNILEVVKDTEQYDVFATLLHTMIISLYIGIGGSTFISLVYFFQLFYSYRKNLQLLYKGDFSKIPKSLLMQPPAKSVTFSLRYAGTQIATLICSFILQFVLIFLTSVTVAYFVILPIFGLAPWTFFTILVNFLCGFVTATLFYFILLLLSKKLLLEKQENADGNEEHVFALKNRAIHHNIAYCLFFFYVILGAFQCIVRIFKAVFLGILYFGRLDKSVMIEGFETWDTGYMAYVSFLRLELAHCHPVLVVFCDMLLEDQQRKKEQKERESNTAFDLHFSATSIQHFSVTESSKVYNRKIKNKWLKIYTLINNPGLRKIGS